MSCVKTRWSYGENQVFFGLRSGKIKTYDLLCSRVSPFEMSCVLNQHRKKLGIPTTLGSLVPVQ